jgi:acetylornithine/N-succinyldiaminopimelate aminotransferase
MPERLMNTYARLPLMFERGEGAWLWDTQGERYLDALSGIAVCALGHAHPAVTDAICQQAGRLVHTSNIYGVQRQQQLAERLTALSGMDKVFFCNSGAEANEAAIKLARLYGHQQGVEVPQVVVFEGSFHGRTLATLSATGNRRIQAGFEPLVQGFVRARYDDLESLQAVARNSRDVVAVLVEPIQGEGGVRMPADDYLAEVRGLCDEHGWLLMLDEIQTGMGRTGDWFAFQHAGIVPDVITLAKALGNGVPIGACLAHGRLADVFQPGSHGSTFGGNPLACSAGLAVLDTLEGQQLPQRARQLGERMLAAFRDRLAGLPGVVQIRGKGLMLGIELDRPCGPLVAKALEQRLLINVTAETSIRLLPPLIISDEQSEQIVDTVSSLVTEFLQG